MDSFNIITDGILFLGSLYFMVPLAIMGYLFFDRKTFAYALFILLFTPSANAFLKMLWKIPLPPGVGTHTYAFPSGHFQAAVVFWGFLAIYYKHLSWKIAIGCFLALNAFAIYIKGYHYPIDLFGAFCFAALSLIIYCLFLNSNLSKRLPSIIGIFLFLLGSSLTIFQELMLINGAIIPALGGLLGFSLGWTLTRWSECTKFNECDNLTILLPNWNMKAKLFSISSLVGGAMIYISFYLLTENIFPSPELKKFAGFFMLSLWIAASPISVISYPTELGSNKT
jgi:hypothetical protein